MNRLLRIPMFAATTALPHATPWTSATVLNFLSIGHLTAKRDYAALESGHPEAQEIALTFDAP